MDCPEQMLGTLGLDLSGPGMCALTSNRSTLTLLFLCSDFAKGFTAQQGLGKNELRINPPDPIPVQCAVGCHPTRIPPPSPMPCSPDPIPVQRSDAAVTFGTS
jgi:hypothetical protein